MEKSDKIKLLGRIAPKSDPRTLNLANFLRTSPADAAPPPVQTNFWHRRKAFKPDSWGNTANGDCTFAKQANMFRRFERLETRGTIDPPDENVLKAYYDCTQRLYGGGDTGAYEEDALSCSRNPDTAIKDSKGRPLLIDAYLRVDPYDHTAVKRALAMAAGHGVAICISLPRAFQSIDPPEMWDIPAGQALTGDWVAGSWGGHSMWAIEYSPKGLLLEHTWNLPPQWISWAAAAAYIDECHIVIDSIDAWRKKPQAEELLIEDVVDHVNSVSSTKIKAR